MKLRLPSLIFIAAVSCLLCCPACKEARLPEDLGVKYSIQGVWQATTLYANGEAHRVMCTFTGSKQSGTVTTDNGGSGTYNVGGQAGITAKWSFSYYSNGNKVTEEYDGDFTDENTICGKIYIDWEQQAGCAYVTQAHVPDGGLLFQAVRQ
jgi:hypothetical protein